MNNNKVYRSGKKTDNDDGSSVFVISDLVQVNGSESNEFSRNNI